MDPISGLVGLGSGIIGGIASIFTGAAQRRRAQAEQAKADGLFDQSTGFANSTLGVAKQNQAQALNQYNGRMAGASNMEANIYGNQANTLGAMGRSSTNAAQQLALAGGVQGNTNQAFNSLNQNEGMNKFYSLLGLQQANSGLMGANENMQGLYANRAGQLQNAATQQGNASQINQSNGINSLANTGMAFAGGAFGNPFGSSSKGGNSVGNLSGSGLGGIDPSNMIGFQQPSMPGGQGNGVSIPGISYPSPYQPNSSGNYLNQFFPYLNGG